MNCLLISPPPLVIKSAILLLLVMFPVSSAMAQLNCLISAEHGTDDKSISSLGNNVLTVDEGGNWYLDLTFSCAGITNTATHDPTIEITGIQVNGIPLWTDDTNDRFSGSVWNQDGFGPTRFGGNDPAGDFSARVRLSGTSVDNNCHDSGASTRMQFTAKIGNSGTGASTLAERTITVTARDDDPRTLTLSPGKPWGRTINDWRQPCS